jgi:hypothetical protein
MNGRRCTHLVSTLFVLNITNIVRLYYVSRMGIELQWCVLNGAFCRINPRKSKSHAFPVHNARKFCSRRGKIRLPEHGEAESVAAFHRRLRKGALTQEELAVLSAEFDKDSKSGDYLGG